MPGFMQSFNKIRPADINLELGIAEQKAMLDYFIFNEPALSVIFTEDVRFLKLRALNPRSH
jgi:hypothetical protein